MCWKVVESLFHIDIAAEFCIRKSFSVWSSYFNFFVNKLQIDLNRFCFAWKQKLLMIFANGFFLQEKIQKNQHISEEMRWEREWKNMEEINELKEFFLSKCNINSNVVLNNFFYHIFISLMFCFLVIRLFHFPLESFSSQMNMLS